MNILMVVADDQRHDTIAALGNPFARTPHYDRIAREGFAFTDARCMGGQHGAVCIPSRAQLHTGRSVFRVANELEGAVTLGEHLMAQGFTTHASGKWHNGEAALCRSFGEGRNIFIGGMLSDQFAKPVRRLDDGKLGPVEIRKDGKFSTDLFSDSAVEFLRAQDGAKPFFCYVAYTSPHDPRTPPPPYDTMYDPDQMPLPENWLPEHPFDLGTRDIRDELLAPHPRTPEDTRRQIADYYGMVSSQDTQVGRLMSALEETGQLADTIVVCTGDHGLCLGSHGLFGKQCCYEEALRIPLLMMGPGIPHGVSDALVYGLDLFPTLCELTGIDVPPDLDGRSLVGLIQGTTHRARDSVYGVYCHQNGAPLLDNQQCVRDRRWKYIRSRIRGAMNEQLFDLESDPAETRNLAGDPAFAQELSRMAAMLLRAQGELGLPRNL